MREFLQGWNERSFLGWRAWGLRIALLALAYVCLQDILQGAPAMTVPPLGLWLRVALLLAGWQLLLARLGAWASGYAWRAVLAGWSRLGAVILLVPVVDAVVAWLAPASGSGWWFAPKLLPLWLLSGWTGTQFASVGLMLAVFASAAFLCFFFRQQRVSWTKSLLVSFLAVVIPWLVLAVPSLTSWSRVSSYGTTFAPANQVIAQAFERAWAHSYWSTNFDRFLDIAHTDSFADTRFLFVVFAWLGVVSLVAPLLWRRAAGAGNLVLQRASLVLAPLFGGYLMTLVSVPGRTWYALGAFILVLFYLAALFTAYLQRLDEADADELWLIRTLIFIGAWILGWGACLGVIVLFFCAEKRRAARAWEVSAFWQACLWVTAFLLGSLVGESGMSMVFWWPPLFVVGLFLLWLVLALLVYGRDQGHPRLGIEFLGATRSIRDFWLLLGVLWFAGLILLWMSLSVLWFGWTVLALAVLGPAVAWFFSGSERSRALIATAFPLLLGILLYVGFFLS